MYHSFHNHIELKVLCLYIIFSKDFYLFKYHIRKLDNQSICFMEVNNRWIYLSQSWINTIINQITLNLTNNIVSKSYLNINYSTYCKHIYNHLHFYTFHKIHIFINRWLINLNCTMSNIIIDLNKIIMFQYCKNKITKNLVLIQSNMII